MAFRTLLPILTVSYIVITVIRIGLVFAGRRRRRRRRSSTRAHFASTGLHVKVLTISAVLS